MPDPIITQDMNPEEAPNLSVPVVQASPIGATVATAPALLGQKGQL